MNVIEGIVQRLNSANGMCEVEIETDFGVFYSIVLEHPGEADFVKEGKPVRCTFKETDGEISKEKAYSINTLEGTVKAIEGGPLISLIRLDCKGKIFNFTTTNVQINALGIMEGDKLYVFLSPMRLALESDDG
ncbi:TOBE domain-containing protein [Thermocrinis sp.]